MNRILCIHLPNWPVQRLVVARPELKGRPVVLYAHTHPRGQRVVACSTAAYRQGVRTDMPLAEAQTLLERVGGRVEVRGERLENGGQGAEQVSGGRQQGARYRGQGTGGGCSEYDPPGDRDALVQLARWCERFSPHVGLEDAAEPTDLLLDITGLTPIFGSEQRLARLIAESFRHRGYHVQIAVADTIGAAWALAHFAEMQANSECGMRNAESWQCKESWQSGGDQPSVPSSAFRIPHSALPPGHGLAPLHELPVSALRLPPETVGLLAELGIERIGELLVLPRESLASRFGDGIAVRIDQAAGTHDEVIVAERPVVDFCAQWSLEYPTHNRQAIEVIVTRLIEQVARRLVQCNEGAIQLECCLTCGKHPARMSIGLFEPTATAPYLVQLICMQFERLTLPQPVQSVSVQATTTARLGQRQRELFAGDLLARPRQLATLVDRLSSRLGRDGVVRPQALYDAQPERSWRYVPLAGQRRPRSHRGNSVARRRKAKTNKPASSRSASPSASGNRREKELTAASRPLRVHSPPAPLETIAVVPDGPPIRFTWQHQLHHIVRHWGPERIETGWWRGRSVRRDYYRVETDHGHRFWLFRQLDDGEWFLHGEFE